MDGEVEGCVEVVVAPDAADGVVVAELGLRIGEEEEDKYDGDEHCSDFVGSREVRSQYL